MNLRFLKLEKNQLGYISVDINYPANFKKVIKLREGQFCSGVHTIERIQNKIQIPDKKMFFEHSDDYNMDSQKIYTLYHVKKYELKDIINYNYDLVFVKEANVYTFIFEGQFE